MGYDLCGLGNALMDVLVKLKDEPDFAALGLTRGQMHLADEARWQTIFSAVKHHGWETSPGGSCANVISTAAVLGARTMFCGQVGADSFGQQYAAAISQVCGGHRLHLLENGNTGKCVSLISPDAERTMITTLGCAIELEPQYLFRDEIEQARFVHLTGYLFTGGRMGDSGQAALELAKAKGVKISFDVADAWVIATFRDRIWKIIEQYTDILFTNEEEARTLCNAPVEEALQMLGDHCETVIIKLGSRGSLIKHGNEVYRIPVYKVKAVDSTGAGDTYAGGFLYALTQGYDLELCGRIGSRIAAETVSQTGAVVRSRELLQSLVAGVAAEAR